MAKITKAINLNLGGYVENSLYIFSVSNTSSRRRRLPPERCGHGQAGGVGQATSGVNYGGLPPGSLAPLHRGLQPPAACAKSLPVF